MASFSYWYYLVDFQKNNYILLLKLATLLFRQIYSATIATSVIKTDASENFVADQSKLNVACVFLWFVSFSMFGHLFIMEGLSF